MTLWKRQSETCREILAIALVGFGWILGYSLFPTVGHWAVARMYAGDMAFAPLNEIIRGQELYTVNHYINYADHLFMLWSGRVVLLLLLVIYAIHHLPSLLKSDAPSFPRYLPPSLLLFLVLLAWVNRFIQDDAFISFRYAANLVQGHGLTWNPGEPHIEGYTNFLWTLLMAIPIRYGLDPVEFSFALGTAFFFCSLLVVHGLARGILGSARSATLCVIVLGTNYTFSAYATGGLETQMQTALLLCVALMVFNTSRAASRRMVALVAISVVSAAAILTRPDSILPLAVIYAASFRTLLEDRTSLADTCARVASLLWPALAIVMIFGLWKLDYYGNLLPNTFHAKVASGPSSIRGVIYLGYFMGSYGWLPFVVLSLVRIRHEEARSFWMRLCIILTAIWLVYVVLVGGCFMEFRLLVPVLPFMVIVMIGTLSKTLQPAGRLAIVAGLVLMSLFHQATFTGKYGVESIRGLQGHIRYGRWEQIGKQLGNIFGGLTPGITIATTASGAIPYYSGLKTIDMLGLNDEWIARHGHIWGTRPGHQRGATAEYIRDRDVNIVVGHPQVMRLDREVESYPLRDAAFNMLLFEEDYLPEGARIIEVPLDHEWAVHVLYFVQHPSMEGVIQRFDLRTFPIEREPERANNAKGGHEG